MRTPEYFLAILEDALSRLKLSAANITDQLPGSALPPGGPSGSGYPAAPMTHDKITDFTAAVTDVVGDLGGFTDPTTTAGDLIYRDGSGPQRLPIGSADQVLTVVSGEPGWAPAASGTIPQCVTCWHDESVVTAGAGVLNTNSTDGGQRYQTYSAIAPAASGDAFAQSVVLDAGSYVLSILGYTDTDQGQVTWTLGAQVLVTGQDWYSGGGAYNVVKTVSFTLATAGRYALTGTISGKNASSSGYVLRLTKFWIR